LHTLPLLDSCMCVGSRTLCKGTDMLFSSSLTTCKQIRTSCTCSNQIAEVCTGSHTCCPHGSAIVDDTQWSAPTVVTGTEFLCCCAHHGLEDGLQKREGGTGHQGPLDDAHTTSDAVPMKVQHKTCVVDLKWPALI